MEQTHMTKFFILTVLICEAITKRDFVMHISDAHCIGPSTIMNITCSITKSNRLTGLNVFLRVSQDIVKMRYNLTVQHCTQNGHWESFFKFSNLDVCEFLGAKFTVPILLIARTLMKKYSNLPEGCPVKKDKDYYIQRMKFDPEQFPPYLPEGHFAAIGFIFDEKIVLVDYHLGIHVAYKSNSKKHFKLSDKTSVCAV